MANQYIHTEYTEAEVQKILDLYALGQSKTQIAHTLRRKKDNIQKILTSNGVWDENRGDWKKVFTESEIARIKNMYVVDGFGTAKIGFEFGVSNQPIKSVLRKLGLLRSGTSSGIKTVLTIEQHEMIKRLYSIEYKNIKEIALSLGLTESFVNKYLSTTGYRRSKSLGTTVGQLRKFSQLTPDEYLRRLPELKKYRRSVLKITGKQPINTLINFDKRGVSGTSGAYHLDHKFSILEGFKHNISPEVIGGIANLEFIPWEENIKKRTRCSINLSKLI